MHQLLLQIRFLGSQAGCVRAKSTEFDPQYVLSARNATGYPGRLRWRRHVAAVAFKAVSPGLGIRYDLARGGGGQLLRDAAERLAKLGRA